MRHQPFRRRKTQLAVADLLRHGTQIRLFRVEQDEQVVPIPLLIPQEEVLAVRGIDTRLVLRRLLDGRDRRMLVAREDNPELGQPRDHGELLECHP